jgi:hypothetical protein
VCRFKAKPGERGAAVLRGLRSSAAGGYGHVDMLRTRTGRGILHGRGVVTTRAIKKGAAIIMAVGVIIARDLRMNPKYMFDMIDTGDKMCEKLDYDMTPTGRSNIVRFINTAHGTRKPGNCELRWESTVPIMYATRDIAAKDELRSNYKYK